MVDEPEAAKTEPLETRGKFSLLVSGVAGAWEGAHLDMDLDQFNAHNGKHGKIVDADDPASLSQLNGAPALVMYELGVGGP